MVANEIANEIILLFWKCIAELFGSWSKLFRFS